MFGVCAMIVVMNSKEVSSEYESTITDVLEAVQSGFSKIDERFEKIDEQFSRHDAMFAILREGQENLKEQLNENTNRLIKTQNRVEDIADTLEIDHERRIARLEKARV